MKPTHLQLLLDDFHVVSLEEVLLVGAHPVQLGQQVAEQHRRHRLIGGCHVPGKQTKKKMMADIKDTKYISGRYIIRNYQEMYELNIGRKCDTFKH